MKSFEPIPHAHDLVEQREVTLWEGRTSLWASPFRFLISPVTYRVTNHRLTEIRSHLLRWSRQVRILDVERVEYVRMRASLWQRLFGVTDLDVHAQWQLARWKNGPRRSALETALRNAGLKIEA